MENPPNHPVKLFLSNVFRNLAVDLTGVQSHRQCCGHVILDGCGDRGRFVGCAHVNLARAQVFEFAGAGLGDFHVGNEGEDDVGWVSLLQMGFNAKGVGSVDENTSVLGSDHGFDDGG